MADKANKVKFGLKNVYYAKVTFDDDMNPTFGTPARIPGAINLSLDAEGESEPWYADDSIYVYWLPTTATAETWRLRSSLRPS